MIAIDKTYILHYEPLVERKKYLDSVLPAISNNYEYIITSSDTDDNIYKNIDNYYKFDASILNRPITKNELSISITHLNVYQDILKNNYKLCLILEDDAILTEEAPVCLCKILNEDISHFDFIFLSTCCNIAFPKISDDYIQPCYASKCMCGYLVNNRKLEEVIGMSKPLSTNIDNHLNIIKDTLNLNFGSCEPPIIIQGSETKYRSNLR